MKIRELLEAESTDAEKVWDRLMSVCPNAESDDTAKKRALVHIKDKLQKGWTATEIVSSMKWNEEFDPDVEEDLALAKMKAVKDKVEARLAAEK